MKKAGGGRLVFVSSLAGMTSVQVCVPHTHTHSHTHTHTQTHTHTTNTHTNTHQGLTAYSPTKYAVRGLAEGLQMELRPYGIYTTVM
jgi:NAD(P)-dependent dehydrogenase (short-subunit alcohol dehydrogenase family)